MDVPGSLRIEMDAVRALAEWKFKFGELVSNRAKELSKSGDLPGLVTLDHYQQAAFLAAKEIVSSLSNPELSDDRRKAA